MDADPTALIPDGAPSALHPGSCSLPSICEESAQIPLASDVKKAHIAGMAKTLPQIDKADLAGIRKEIGWTQQEFADYLGVTRETVSRREAGTAEISRETELAMRFALISKTGKYDFPWRTNQKS